MTAPAGPARDPDPERRPRQPRSLPSPVETEAGFMGWLIEYAHWNGWIVAHFRPAMTAHGWRTPVQADGKGWPDLAIVRPPRYVAAEVKRDAPTEAARERQVAREQRRWLDALGACPGVEVYLWRPTDRPDIERILA
jgi:hypothetical protein